MLENKTGVVLGVANKRSIGWAVARAADQAGARLVITYQNERLQKGVAALAEGLSREPVLVPCDVSSEEDLDRLFQRIGEECGHLDFLVHALAFARKEDLGGAYHEIPREGWHTALDVSAFSFTALAAKALPLMEGRGGSLVTMSYLGGQRVVPHYNVMGVAKAALESSVRYLANDLGPLGHRVNAVSAGPVKTLAAASIPGFSRMLEHMAEHSPLRRNVEAREVADATVFLLSDHSRAVTGEILHVDCGYHAMGV